MKHEKPWLVDSPFALAATGEVLLGVTHVLAEPRGTEEVIRRALATGRPLFIGLEATASERITLRKKLAEAASEAVATTYRERT